MADASKVKQAVEWYSKTKILYEALAKKVESIVREILKSKDINYYRVTSRAKSIPRYEEKASKKKYKEPRSEIFDMAGIRVITYTTSDARHVHEIIKQTFELHPEHSVDKGEELGVDRMGYRSIHCVGTLGKDRVKLPENKIFKKMFFEIQIRTILQHAWAEFEHDRNYKFAGVLPKEIRRRLSAVAGSLELTDREFDSIALEIDTYSVNVGRKTEAGELSIPVNSTSLRAYLMEKFKTLFEEGLLELIPIDEDLIEELISMGIETIKDLDSIIPKDYAERARPSFLSTIQREGFGTNFYGIIRDVLMIHDVDKYFKVAWNKRWLAIDKSGVSLIESYGVDLEKYIKLYGITLF